MATPRTLSIVVPVFNEAEALPELFSRLEKAAKTVTAAYEIVFVDDGSTDRSFAVLRDIHARSKRVSLIQLRRNNGKASALAVGFEQATGEFVITVDADLQDQPEEIPRIVERLEEGDDLVCGWRANRRDPSGKVRASRFFNRLTRWIGRVPLHDMNCGLKGFRRDVIDDLHVRGELHRYIPLIAHWRGFAVGEVEVAHAPRRFGESKYGRERFLRGFFDLLTVLVITRYLQRPLHLFGGLGILLTLLGFSVNLYLTIGWLLGAWWLGDRPLLVLGVLLMIVGVQFVLFGLLAEIVTYSSRVDNEVLVRTRLPRTPGE